MCLITNGVIKVMSCNSAIHLAEEKMMTLGCSSVYKLASLRNLVSDETTKREIDEILPTLLTTDMATEKSILEFIDKPKKFDYLGLKNDTFYSTFIQNTIDEIEKSGKFPYNSDVYSLAESKLGLTPTDSNSAEKRDGLSWLVYFNQGFRRKVKADEQGYKVLTQEFLDQNVGREIMIGSQEFDIQYATNGKACAFFKKKKNKIISEAGFTGNHFVRLRDEPVLRNDQNKTNEDLLKDETVMFSPQETLNLLKQITDDSVYEKDNLFFDTDHELSMPSFKNGVTISIAETSLITRARSRFSFLSNSKEDVLTWATALDSNQTLIKEKGTDFVLRNVLFNKQTLSSDVTRSKKNINSLKKDVSKLAKQHPDSIFKDMKDYLSSDIFEKEMEVVNKKRKMGIL